MSKILQEKPFRVAFLFSLGLHTLLLSPITGFMGRPVEIEKAFIEVTYVEIEEEPIASEAMPVEAAKTILKAEEAPSRAAERERAPEEAKRPVEPQEEPVPTEAVADDRAIDLNSLTLKDGRSEYLNYLRSIRNKINLYVHRHYDVSMGKGEALLRFALKPDGGVRSTSLVADTFGGNMRLRRLCLESVRLSSPFAPFPDDLDLPQAVFTINISFNSR